jgi:hypothetical protein
MISAFGHRIEERQRNRYEANLGALSDALFRRCPALCGFSVHHPAKLPCGRTFARVLH